MPCFKGLWNLVLPEVREHIVHVKSLFLLIAQPQLFFSKLLPTFLILLLLVVDRIANVVLYHEGMSARLHPVNMKVVLARLIHRGGDSG